MTTARPRVWRASVAAALSLGFVGLLAPPTEANGIFRNGIGARAMALGGADVAWAEDALGAVRVRYAPLPAVVDARVAGRPDAPLLFESEGSNVVASYTVECGNVDTALREADLVLRERLDVQRHAGVPLETRGALAEWDAGRGVLSMWGMTKVEISVSSALERSVTLR